MIGRDLSPDCQDLERDGARWTLWMLAALLMAGIILISASGG